MNAYYWSEQEDSLLKELYTKQNSRADILEAFPHRTYASIKYRAKFLNIKKTRLQYKNESFFEQPNECNCSVAGMIASDGNIQLPKKKNGYRIILGLCSQDRQILQDIIKVVGSNAKINNCVINKKISTLRSVSFQTKEYFSSYVTFSSAYQWIADLKKHWNITEKKSLTLFPPNIIDLNFSLAYIVGLINGDGTIGLQKTKTKNYFYLRLLGTKSLLDWVKLCFQTYLREPIRGTVHLERKDSNIYNLQINGFQAIKLFKKMNSLSCVKLIRKWTNPVILELIVQYQIKYPHLFAK